MNTRRALPWLVLAVGASLVPMLLGGLTWHGLPLYLPVFSLVGMVDGFGARRLWPWTPDFLIANYLPLVVLVAAVLTRLRRWAGPVMAGALGAMAAVDLVVAVDMLPPDLIGATISAGSQPDYIDGGPMTFAPYLAGAAAYGVAAVALVLGSRRPGRRTGNGSTSKMPRSR
ncbi:hypothetical protein [Microbispora bryophytorum]|uniref:hypothetical protein n=1 Tax=Microbispora bryophytorum TaxID=1460882 RepID=UPI0033D2CC00